MLSPLSTVHTDIQRSPSGDLLPVKRVLKLSPPACGVGQGMGAKLAKGLLLKLHIGNKWSDENKLTEKRQEEFGIRMVDSFPGRQREVKGCLLSVNISETLWLLILEDDQTLPQSFHQQIATDINVEELTVLIVTVSPVKGFTPQGTACYLFRLSRRWWDGKEMERNVLLVRFTAICEPEKGVASPATPTSFPTSLVFLHRLILVFLCIPTHNSSCCPLVLLQLPITPTRVLLCQLVSQLPHSVTLLLSTKRFSNDSAWSTPCPTLPCVTHARLITCCSTSVTNYYCLCHLGPFSLAPASPPMPFRPFH